MCRHRQGQPTFNSGLKLQGLEVQQGLLAGGHAEELVRRAGGRADQAGARVVELVHQCDEAPGLVPDLRQPHLALAPLGRAHTRLFTASRRRQLPDCLARGVTQGRG